MQEGVCKRGIAQGGYTKEGVKHAKSTDTRLYKVLVYKVAQEGVDKRLRRAARGAARGGAQGKESFAHMTGTSTGFLEPE